MLTQGRFDPLAVTQHVSDFSSARPPTRSRENGRVALTVLQPHPEVVLAAQAAEDALHVSWKACVMRCLDPRAFAARHKVRPAL
jgi:hypothetical protein